MVSMFLQTITTVLHVGLIESTTVVHNTAQNSSDNSPPYPPDNHRSSDDVYWRGAGKTADDEVHNSLANQDAKSTNLHR